MIKLAYIVSPSYSGSTLLTFLLGAHPDIATVGELKATSMGDVDQYRCSCGELIRSCGFWRTLTERLGERSVDFDVADFGTHFRLDNRGDLADRLLSARVRTGALEMVRGAALRVLPRASDEMQRILERNLALVTAITEINGAGVFLDGSKDPIRLKHLHASGLWHVKVVHLIRDGRGCSNSYMKHYESSMAVAAEEWLKTHDECERMRKLVTPDDWHTMSYEKLCADPSATIGAAYRFIGVDPARAPGDLRATEHHILGNAMRLGSPKEIRQDEKWRRELTQQDLATFASVAGRRNRDYGYD